MQGDFSFNEDEERPAQRPSSKQQHFLIRYKIVKTDKQAILLSLLVIFIAIISVIIISTNTDSLPRDLAPRNTPSGIEL